MRSIQDRNNSICAAMLLRAGRTAATVAVPLLALLLATAPASADARDRGINQPGRVGNTTPRDPGVNQPGAAGNVKPDPGVNQPGGVRNVKRDPGVNQPGAAGNVKGDPGVNQSGAAGNPPRR